MLRLQGHWQGDVFRRSSTPGPGRTHSWLLQSGLDSTHLPCELLCPLQEGQPEDLDERQAWVWWKVKKWVLHVTHRLFKRYADIKAVNNELEKAFAHLWIRDCNIRFLEGHMQLAAALSQVWS